MGAFLDKWDGHSGPEIELKVEGVTQSDVSRWRGGDWAWISHKKARAIQVDLAHDKGDEQREKRIAAKWFRLKADELEREAADATAPPAAGEKELRDRANSGTPASNGTTNIDESDTTDQEGGEKAG